MSFVVDTKDREFKILFKEETDEGYSAQRIELPGAISQGENREQAIANIREAIEGYLEAFPEELNQLKRKKELVDSCLKSCLFCLGEKLSKLCKKKKMMLLFLQKLQ